MDNNDMSQIGISLRCVLDTLKHKTFLIFTVMLACGILLDIGMTAVYRPVFASTITATIENGDNAYGDLEGTRDYIRTLDYILNGQMVNEHVAREMGQEHVPYRCHVYTSDSTNMVTVKVTASSQKNAYFILSSIISWYETNTKDLQFLYQIRNLQRPSVNEYPVNPNDHAHNFLKGFLLSGIGLVFLIGLVAYLRDTVKAPGSIETKIQCRLYSKIPREKSPVRFRSLRNRKEASLITSAKTSFAFRESIYKLRRRVEESASDHGYRCFMLTSAVENEGKSSVAANLAIALAKNHHKVLLVDGDLRKPAIHKILSLEKTPCINSYLSGHSSWEENLQYQKGYDLHVLTAHPEQKKIEEIFASSRWEDFLQEAREQYDFIILDSSPAVFFNEPVILNELVDATLLIIRQNFASCSVINSTIERLRGSGDHVIGAIVNAVFSDTGSQHKYSSYYSHYSHKEGGHHHGT